VTTGDRRDGRILPATHWASLVVFAILVPALVILWGLPGRTADAWAWTIEPDLTPIFLGAGYGAGAYFFLRTFLADRFPRRRASSGPPSSRRSCSSRR
jgi:hypothetical protein